MQGRDHLDGQRLVQQLREWARPLGFSQIGVAGVDLADAEPGWRAWLDAGFHGEMGYMAAHGTRRTRPAELRPGTVSIITARMDYLPRAPGQGEAGEPIEGGPSSVGWIARERSRASISCSARARPDCGQAPEPVSADRRPSRRGSPGAGTGLSSSRSSFRAPSGRVETSANTELESATFIQVSWLQSDAHPRRNSS